MTHQFEDVCTEQLLSTIVMPVAAHADIDRLLAIVCALAKTFASEVHLYQLMRPGELASDTLLKNKMHMIQCFKAEGIRYVEVNEPSSIIIVGFTDSGASYGHTAGFCS